MVILILTNILNYKILVNNISPSRINNLNSIKFLETSSNISKEKYIRENLNLNSSKNTNVRLIKEIF
jgi:hypothetical protein